MAHHRHKAHKANGGKVSESEHRKPKAEVKSNVEKEAEERKHGGRTKEVGHPHGHKGHHRLDKRARGGRCGDMKHSPFSPAHVKTNGDA